MKTNVFSQNLHTRQQFCTRDRLKARLNLLKNNNPEPKDLAVLEKTLDIIQVTSGDSAGKILNNYEKGIDEKRAGTPALLRSVQDAGFQAVKTLGGSLALPFVLEHSLKEQREAVHKTIEWNSISPPSLEVALQEISDSPKSETAQFNEIWLKNQLDKITVGEAPKASPDYLVYSEVFPFVKDWPHQQQ
jgi:hypothetical protein